MLKLSKKSILVIFLVAIILIGTGVGGYFLFRNLYPNSTSYTVDKYPELLDMCDVKESEDTLSISCKALILQIRPDVENPCLDSLIITNSKELKEFSICEKEKTFVWTNEILQYKQLKPIVINIQYLKENLLRYSLNDITFENISDEYIQEIVNRDIEEIMGMDRNATTIKNSFDFCPRPDILPDYIIKKEEYTKYWEENILSRKEYENEELYSTKDRTIRILFGCDSKVNLGYTKVCAKLNILLTKDLLDDLKNLDPTVPNWQIESLELKESYQAILKQISFLYDRVNILLTDFMPLPIVEEQNKLIKTTSDALESTIDTLSRDSTDEDVFCSTYKLLKNLDNKNAQIYANKMEEIIGDDLLNFKSPICLNSLTLDFVDKSGLYIRNMLSSNAENMMIFNRCLNLQEYINE